MTTVLEFKRPERQAHEQLLRSDPFPDLDLSPEARLIYLRIIDESEPGVLLRTDRIFLGLTAQQTALALQATDGSLFVEEIAKAFDQALNPELGQEYINQILTKGKNNASE